MPVISLRAHSGGDARSGFSLIEMLITLALILVMVTMMYSFSSKSHQQTQKEMCAKNLQTIYLALDIYSKENSGTLPYVAGAKTSEEPLSILVPRYTVASQAFVCPGSKDDKLPNGEPFAQRRISYAYLMGQRVGVQGGLLMSDRQLNTRPKLVGQLVFSTNGEPPANNHHKFGGSLLYVDGRTESIGAKAPFALTWPTNVTFLNPK